RIVVAHLGAGASLCAVSGGRSVDTTMGFTPLEGVVMATRSGTVDPAIPLWLQETAGIDAAEVHDGLEHRSGLAGLSDGFAADGDIRTVRLAADRGSSSARLALDVLGWSVRRGIGSMAASLDGVDVVVFTGGVGEHDADLRAEVCDGLSYLGVRLDPEANAATHSDAVVSTGDAAAAVVVVTAAEDRQIAREAGALLRHRVSTWPTIHSPNS
ncbi:MAG: acetate/propionate family kinase, partial [Acidimicrobiia bacterium]|nr:acetate/propionate family kinase [Acidimicrobiia bacterium]